MRLSPKGVVAAVMASGCPLLDSVLDRVRRELAGRPDVSFPRRIITRPVAQGDELHQTVTPAQFEEMRRGGRLCCAWSENGRNFGLPGSVAEDLAAGRLVVMAVGPAALAPLSAMAREVVLIRLVRPGEEPEMLAQPCDREITLTVAGETVDAAVAVLSRCLSDLPHGPLQPPRRGRPRPAAR